MAELKTKLNEESVEQFLNSIEKEQKKSDSFKVLFIMEEVADEKEKYLYGV